VIIDPRKQRVILTYATSHFLTDAVLQRKNDDGQTMGAEVKIGLMWFLAKLNPWNLICPIRTTSFDYSAEKNQQYALGIRPLAC